MELDTLKTQSPARVISHCHSAESTTDDYVSVLHANEFCSQHSDDASKSIVTDVNVNCLFHEAKLSSFNSVENAMSRQALIDKSPCINTEEVLDSRHSFKPWFSKKGLKIVHLNIHYLYPKLDEIKLTLSKQDIDILCLCETFLNDTFSENELNIDNYKLFRKDRHTLGGGLIIYIRDDIPCNHRNDLESTSIETLCIEIKQPNSKSFLLSYVYRPPSSKVQWIKDFTLIMEKSLPGEKECIVIGDFNFDLLKTDNYSKSWLELMESMNFAQLVKDPTRVTSNSATMIDHAFSNIPLNISCVNVPCYSISDHYPVCITRKIASNYVKGPVHKSISYRSMKTFNENEFLDDLSNQPWFLIDIYDNPDDATELFLELFQSVLNKHAPQRKRRVKRLNQPRWMKPEILQAIIIRDHFHKNVDIMNYKIWRQNVKDLIVEAKHQFYNETINLNKRNPKSLWNSLQGLSGCKTQVQTNYIDDDNGNPITNPSVSANVFNNHFCSVFQTVQRNIQPNNDDEINVLSESNKEILNSTPPFVIPQVNMSFVESQLKSLDTGKSTGSDGLSARFLKMSASIIAPVLTKIYNISIKTCIYPQKFKNAKVVPIHKKGAKNDKTNYRPISILPIISLILERHVSIYLKEHFEKNGLFYSRQSGFRTNHSCQTALVKLLDEWVAAIDNNEIVGTLFLDLSKAFDLVDHDILLKKLKLYKVDQSVYSWFSSYLENRLQQTHVSGVSSDLKQVVSGVPQGSILGPLLFLIFINDLPLAIKHSTTDIFADDTTLSVHNSSLNQIAESLTCDLVNVNSWCDLNRMSINVAKTKTMVVSSKPNANRIQNHLPFIELNNENIKYSSEEKLLGITIDRTLSWDKHVEIVLKKCNSLLYLLSRIKIFLTVPMRKLFFNAYILPHLDYCCVIWGNCNITQEDKLIRFQKRAARLILDKDFTTPSKSLFSELNWLTFPKRVKFQKAVLLYKIFNGLSPDYLRNIFTFTSDIHERTLRSSSQFQLYSPRPNTELFRKSFVYSGSIIWNSLPYYVKNANSVIHFKQLYLQWSKQEAQS